MHVELKRGEWILTNTSPIDAKHLVYSTGCTHFDFAEEGDIVVSRRPRYRVAGLPSGCSITLEKVDPHEDGNPWFKIEEAEWADGLREGSCPIIEMNQLLIFLAMSDRHEERLGIRAEMVPVTRHLDAQPEFVDAEESRLVRAGDSSEDA